VSERSGLGLRGARREDHELVAAEPDEQVRAAGAGAQRPRDCLEHVVADLVAVGVVDRLEPVNIDEYEAVGKLLCLRAPLENGKCLVASPAVAETGERVLTSRAGRDITGALQPFDVECRAGSLQRAQPLLPQSVREQPAVRPASHRTRHTGLGRQLDEQVVRSHRHLPVDWFDRRVSSRARCRCWRRRSSICATSLSCICGGELERVVPVAASAQQVEEQMMRARRLAREALLAAQSLQLPSAIQSSPSPAT
jgi:hypothetical protein